MSDCTTFDVHLFNGIVDLQMSCYGTVVPEGLLCVVYATRHQVYGGLTQDEVFRWYSNLISHTQTHKRTQNDAQHTQS